MIATLVQTSCQTNLVNMTWDSYNSNINKRKTGKTPNYGKRTIYDEYGRINRTGEDLCDCSEVYCPGCFFPCPKCNSNKCGHICRTNRKWMYEKIEIEGKNVLKK